MAILNKYKRWKPILLLDKSKYYDFVLSLDDAGYIPLNGILSDSCLISYIDTEKNECIIGDGGLISLDKYTYEKSINSGYKLLDIGLTGTDNGQILFDKNNITEEEYITILSDSNVIIKKNDMRLQLFPVSGNTMNYTYSCNIIEEDNKKYYTFNGGFLQGIFKGFGFDYQVLPQYIDVGLNLEFVIRPRTDYIQTGNTLNNIYPENKGIFFYIGTRAENKFTQFYNYDFSKFKKRKNTTANKNLNNKLITSEGHIIENKNRPDIITDNGYIIYGRGCNDFTIKDWKQGDKLKLIDNAKLYKDNLYLLLNRGCSGYTVNTLEKNYKEEPSDPKEIINDLIDNAFALKITDDGRVGYKYLVRDCNKELQYTIKEEYSFKNTIKKDEWNVVNVLFKIIDGGLNQCDVPFGERKMKIYIYVNGYLKFVSQELPELRLRELSEIYEKQECVPFNISLGGGTQGLCESTWINSYDGFPYILPIEENFAGSFIGDIKSFKIYNCQQQFFQIKNNYLYELKNMV